MRVSLRVQEVAGYVSRIDRLDQHRATRFRQLTRGESKVLDKHRAMRRSIAAGRNDSAHHVQVGCLGCFGVFQRAGKGCAKVAFTPRKRSQSALAGGDFAGP